LNPRSGLLGGLRERLYDLVKERLRHLQGGEVRLGEEAVVRGTLLLAHAERLLAPFVPKTRLLHHLRARTFGYGINFGF
jgi:hypothetical protein